MSVLIVFLTWQMLKIPEMIQSFEVMEHMRQEKRKDSASS